MSTCDCTEEYGPCEDHGTVLAQREGASLRTADELSAVLVLDARDAGADVSADDVALAESIEGWADDPDTGDAIHEAADRAAAALPDGMRVYREDGYSIVRVTGGPLLDD